MSTSFENSAMKSSFSLSSLRSPPAPAAGGARQPGGGGGTTSLERPYHSLNKKRKDPGREAWRRSWGSAASGGAGGGGGGGGSVGDDLWPLLQHHYDYIMDNHLIDSCQEANGELSPPKRPSSPPGPATFNPQWSLGQLTAEFTDMCQWLTAIQEEIYSSPENLSDRTLRTSWLGAVTEAEWRRARFAEQAAAVLERLPEAREEVAWRARHLHAKWECVRLLVSPEDVAHAPHTVDTAHEMKCLRRWLHSMEGRLPPPSLSAARSVRHADLYRRLREHQVLQRDVECHGRVVSSVVRLCGGADAARALERRWHLLYLRAIEWQCHLEACLARIENQQGPDAAAAASDSDSEPALKQPRLCLRVRSSPRRLRRTPRDGYRYPRPHPHPQPASSADSDDSYSEEEPEEREEYLIGCPPDWSGSEPELAAVPRRSPSAPPTADMDLVDGHCEERGQDVSMYNDDAPRSRPASPAAALTPPTVVKRRRPVDSSRFNQSDRKSKNCATFYFKHHDTDSERARTDADAPERPEDSSEEEWTYRPGAEAEEAMPSTREPPEPPEPPMPIEAPPPSEAEPVPPTRCNEDIERLVNQAERLVQAGAKKTKLSRSFKPLPLEPDSAGHRSSKIKRITEWLQQNSEPADDNFQCTESYDASGEYTTDASAASDGSAGDAPAAPPAAPAHPHTPPGPPHAKVVLRKKRTSSGPRPWSVSCLAQVSRAGGAGGAGGSLAATPTEARARAAAMSISESALNTLAHARCIGAARTKLQSSTSSVKTAVQGHISSSTTIDETCVSCYEAGSLRRRRLRRRTPPGGAGAGAGAGGERARADRLVKSSSFSGRLAPRIAEDKHERSAASDPATRKYRFDTTSTSGNESEEEPQRPPAASVAQLRRGVERTHIAPAAAPSFRLGAAGGPVRPRPPPADRERSLLAASLGDPSRLWDLADRDSDVDRSVRTAGTEHSSFSEQAWDFYQEKYNSEPYSEAPDSDAARRLLEFGDDYRAYLDSQSDCCSSLSQHEQPRLLPLPLHRHRRSPGEAPSRKPKSMSSAERKKSLLDSLERSRGGRRRTSSEEERRGESGEEVAALLRRSASRLRDTEALVQRDAAAELLRAADYVRTTFPSDPCAYADAACGRRPGCLRARLALALAAVSLLLVVYIHLR